jgi:3,2-trans-enoyl-CoA isomerase
MWAALHDALQAVEADPAMRGVIITSGLKRDVFTAGNDLRELHAPLTSAAQYRGFWEAQSRCLTGLYGSRLATVAAIRGACPAGGCAIALCCDARLMTGGPGASSGSSPKSISSFIGLNEVALGIPVPKFWAGVMAQVIGQAPASRLLLSGAMAGPAQALQLGLVDELLPDGAALLARAHELAAAAVKLPARARAATKQRLRGEYAAAWLEYALTWEAGPEGFAQITHPDTVTAVGGALRRLSGGGGQRSKPPASKL